MLRFYSETYISLNKLWKAKKVFYLGFPTVLIYKQHICLLKCYFTKQIEVEDIEPIIMQQK